jgi:ribosomal protein L40E
MSYYGDVTNLRLTGNIKNNFDPQSGRYIMAKKSLGYVRTEWTCPNCQTRNPGPQKTCSSCGMPQPDDVQFEQAAQEQIITNEAEIAKAKAGPDIHCYYCGSRNAGNATTCSQCGADLTQGTARNKGQVMGTHRDKPAPKITCQSCGAENEPDAAKCAQCGSPLPKAERKPEPAVPAPAKRRTLWAAIAGGILLLCCVAIIVFGVLSVRTNDINGRVDDVSWSRTIVIEALEPVTHEGWRDEIPVEAIVGQCTEKLRDTEQRATGQQREVCGTPYTEDTGSGYAEVVQDCTTEDIYESVPVYDDMCQYIVDEWIKVDEIVGSGNNLDPEWPSTGTLNRNQRQGEQIETYEVTFGTEDGRYTYSPESEEEFGRYEIGSRWILKVNTFGAVTDTEPMR